MRKTLQEQIEVMQYFAKFNDEVEQLCITASSAISEKWKLKSSFPFDWQNYDYRIKEQKKTITIERWLLELNGEITVEEGNKERLDSWASWNKVKLLETYEVEL